MILRPCALARALRWFAAVAPLAFVALACRWDPFFPQDVVFTFDNRTDTFLCFYLSPENAAAANCNQELAPQAETQWGRDCDGDDDRPIRVIIATKEDRSEIYDRTVSCGEWHDTDRRLVIEQDGEEFIVRDGLADATPSP